MAITAEKVGRDLHLRMEGIEAPFVVHPLPGRAGVQITDTYLTSMNGEGGVEDITNALIMAVDGARQNAITGIWEPVPEDEQVNFTRIGLELSQDESESILMPAFFWQTILGIKGVQEYIEGGEGLSGTLKAAGALTARLGRLTRRTSPRASATV
ncbi:hypothetical protein [Microbacterium sp. BR1]|uniref:hypothetical protein n=1 Tax=Microbacterium sp. BR1 TaxID=1070896 RepID=UPI0012FD1294|nr:hypothetical protein [Microbacterium sp. BR1]